MLTIHSLFEEYGFCSDASSYFSEQYQKLTANKDAYSIFCAQIQAYRDDISFDYLPVVNKLHLLAKEMGIHTYTVEMLYILWLMLDLKAHYLQENIPMQYYDSFAENLKAYAVSCKTTHGVWGTDIAWWLIDFFKLKLFSVGRLQFKRRKLRKAMGGYAEGSYYIDVHIPGGAPLTPALCAASYAEAAAFFRMRYGMEYILFGCHSWLLSPELNNILPAKSNILAFAHDYTIWETRTDPTSSAVSFIFNVPALPADINTLPEDTSLRKALKMHLKAGNSINTAFGLMHYK